MGDEKGEEKSISCKQSRPIWGSSMKGGDPTKTSLVWLWLFPKFLSPSRLLCQFWAESRSSSERGTESLELSCSCYTPCTVTVRFPAIWAVPLAELAHAVAQAEAGAEALEPEPGRVPGVESLAAGGEAGGPCPSFSGLPVSEEGRRSHL